MDAKLELLAAWSGAAADSAKATFADYRNRLAESAEIVDRIPPIFSTAGPVIGNARARLLQALEAARSAGLEVNADTGQVTLSLAPPNPHGVDLRRREEIQAWINDAVADATRADAEAAGALRELTAQKAGLAPSPGDATVTASAIQVPPIGVRGLDVEKVADYLTALRRWWAEHGFAGSVDSWEKARFVTVENAENGFRMAFQDGGQGAVSIGASSPCVWPDGTAVSGG